MVFEIAARPAMAAGKINSGKIKDPSAVFVFDLGDTQSASSPGVLERNHAVMHVAKKTQGGVFEDTNEAGFRGVLPNTPQVAYRKCRRDAIPPKG